MPKKVDIDLDGETYTLEYDMNALAAIEERTGQKFGELFGEDEMPSMTDTRTVLWAGLMKSHDLDEEDVGSMIGPGELEGVFERVTEAFGAAMEGGDTDVLGKSNSEAEETKPSESSS